MYVNVYYDIARKIGRLWPSDIRSVRFWLRSIRDLIGVDRFASILNEFDEYPAR